MVDEVSSSEGHATGFEALAGSERNRAAGIDALAWRQCRLELGSRLERYVQTLRDQVLKLRVLRKAEEVIVFDGVQTLRD